MYFVHSKSRSPQVFNLQGLSDCLYSVPHRSTGSAFGKSSFSVQNARASTGPCQLRPPHSSTGRGPRRHAWSPTVNQFGPGRGPHVGSADRRHIGRGHHAAPASLWVDRHRPHLWLISGEPPAQINKIQRAPEKCLFAHVALPESGRTCHTQGERAPPCAPAPGRIDLGGPLAAFGASSQV